MSEQTNRDDYSVPEYKSSEIDFSLTELDSLFQGDSYLPYNGLDAEFSIEPIEITRASDKHQASSKAKSDIPFSFDPNILIEYVLDFIYKTGDITIKTVQHFSPLNSKKLKKRSRRFKRKLSSVKVGFKEFAISFTEAFTLKNLNAKTVFNLAFPLVAVVIMLLTVSHMRSTTLALDVVYNNKHIGYVENEETFEEAKALALKMMPSQIGKDNEIASVISGNPTYKLSRVNFNELSNSSMICENIIRSSDVSLVRACGIYIDGEFLCAVSNESDAVSVFNSIIAPSKAKAAADTIVAFVEEIEYVQGLYPDNKETVWDSLKLKKTLRTPKSEAKYYTIALGDNASSIASKNDLTVKQLKALNPETNFSKLKVGRQLLIAPETQYVRVKVMKTRIKKQRLPYETIKKETNYYSKGTTKVGQDGRYGEKVTTELVTYINGVETYSTVVSVKQTKAPVNKIIYIGTKEAYSGYNYGGSTGYTPSYSSGFIWPTRGAYGISSYYGYRSAWISGWAFHGGIDIVRSGGPSTGVPVIAAASGTVIVAQSGYSGYGHTVLIDHGNGLQTRYAHMYPGSITVYPGQRVYQGQQIGQIGATGNVTGPHLHFEVLRYGSKVNPLGYIR